MEIETVPERMYATSRGYFAFPLIEEDLQLEDFDEWNIIADFVECAKRGDFAAITPILALYDRDAHWVRRGAYVDIIGDAGTDALLERIHHHLLGGLPADYSWDLAEVLCYWGRLDVVPTLVRGWRSAHQYDDAEYIPPQLSMLLEESPGPIRTDWPRPRKVNDDAAEAYLELVLTRHAELVDDLGERAFVFRGRLLDVKWIAQSALVQLAAENLDWRAERDFEFVRHKFEAMTGIDCSSFYRNRRLQPLAAAALFESFLASPDRERFIPGRRYFFGHPIPPGDPVGAAEWPPR